MIITGYQYTLEPLVSVPMPILIHNLYIHYTVSHAPTVVYSLCGSYTYTCWLVGLYKSSGMRNVCQDQTDPEMQQVIIHNSQNCGGNTYCKSITLAHIT